jgi:hypothetical protein
MRSALLMVDTVLHVANGADDLPTITAALTGPTSYLGPGAGVALGHWFVGFSCHWAI